MPRNTIVALMLAAAAAPGPVSAAVTPLETGGFSVTRETLIRGATPEEVYDAATGDISGWWDHHMSEKPAKLFIEARPGGGFLEIFDDSGDGVLHATVIYAHRGKRLTFVGPLGFSGNALDLVVTYTFSPHAEGTLMEVTCNAEGQVEETWGPAVDGVWRHFLVERLKPYVEERAGR